MDKSDNIPAKLSIQDWSVQDRPREKFLAGGAAMLSNAELIAIILRTGSNTENAVDLAKRLLKSCNNQLNILAGLSTKQLTDTKGIGEAKAITLQAAFELGNRIRSEKVKQQTFIHNAEDVLQLMQDKIAYLKHEEFWAIYLDNSNKILSTQQICKGGIDQTIVDVRLILQNALLQSSTTIIVCHNHPSGSMRPSTKDISLTQQIQKAADLLNIRLLDHIIVHKNTLYSFHDQGKL